MTRRLAALLWIVVAASLAATGRVQAQSGSLEYPVKAAFLYKFGSFVTWPAPAFEAQGAPVVVCVLGDDPFGSQLDRLVSSATVGGRPLTVRRLARVGPESGCHILYVGGSQAQPAAEALRAVAGVPVLTVTDEARGGARGAVHFVVRQNRVRFEIDPAAAARNGLQVSSKLLNLALAVTSR